MVDEGSAERAEKIKTSGKRGLLILLIAVAVGSAVYGLTQWQYRRSVDVQRQLREELVVERLRSEQATAQMDVQSQQLATMQSRIDLLTDVDRTSSRDRTEVVIRTVYDDRGNVKEKVESTIGESSTSAEKVKTSSTTMTAATSTTAMTASSSSTSTVTTAETARMVTEASETVKVSTQIGAVSGKTDREQRFVVGAALYDGKVKPVAGYGVRAFGVGKLISVWPSVIAGDNVVGAGLGLDAIGLPRVGVGGACTMKGKSCKEVVFVGVRLDM